MKTIILIIALSACVLGIASAAPYPVSSSETALLNRIMTAEKTAQMQGVEDGKDYKAFQELMESIQSITSGGYTNIQESEDAEAQLFGSLGMLAASIILPEVISRLTGGEVTIQETEDIADLQMLLENIESSSVDKEAKVQFIGGLVKGLKAGLKLFPKAFGLLKKGGKKAWEFAEKLTPGLLVSDLVGSIGGSIQTHKSEDGADMEHLLQLLEDTSSNGMNEEADAQRHIKNQIFRNTFGRLGSYIIKKNPKLIDYIKSGTVGAIIGLGGDRLLKKIFGEKIMARVSGEAGDVPRYEKLFELLNQEPEGGMDKEAKTSFYDGLAERRAEK